MKIIFILLFIVCLFVDYSFTFSCEPYYNPNTNKTYNISPLTRSGYQQDWVAYDISGRDFYFNFCAETQILCTKLTTKTPQAACDYVGDDFHSLGDLDSMVFSPLGDSDGLTVSYNTTETTCGGGLLSPYVNLHIELYCDPLVFGVVYNSTLNFDTCITTIEFHSVFACGKREHSPISPTPIPSPLPSPVSPPTSPYENILGSELMGCGYNIFSTQSIPGTPVGKPLTSKIIGDYSFYNNATWSIKYNGNLQTFSVPDQLSISRGQKFGIQTFTYQSVSEYLDQSSKNLAMNAEGEYYHIPLGANVLFGQINDELEANDGTLAVVEETIALFELRLYPNLDLLDSTFINDVMNVENKIMSFTDFYTKYGTHIQTGITMGGRLGMLDVITAEERQTLTEVEIGAGIRVAFINRQNQPYPMYVGINKNTTVIPIETDYYFSKVGGNPSISFSQECGYQKWVDSVPFFPANVQNKIHSIIPYIRRVSPSVAKEYIKYLATVYDSLFTPSYKSPPNVVTLVYGSNGTSSDGIISIPVWTTDDDDDCLECVWAIETDDDTDIGLERRAPSLVSWKANGHLGETGFADSQSTIEQLAKLSDNMCSNTLTSVEHINGQCGLYPCIPGLDLIGIGYDIITGVSKLPAFEWTFNENKLYNDPFNGNTYAYPDQIYVQTGTSSTATNRIFTSFEDFATYGSTSASGWDGLIFQFDPETQSVSKSFDGSQSILGVSEQQYVLHTMQVNNATITSQLQQAMNELPEKYEYLAYSEFLSFWGTHIGNQGGYGGKVKLISMIDQEVFLKHDTESMEISISAQFQNYGAGIAWGNTYNDTTAEFSQESFQWLTFYGGAGSLALTSQWNSWVNSTYTAPAQIYQNLVPIQDYAPNPTIAANIEHAIDIYNSENNPIPLPEAVLLDMSITKSHGNQITSDYATTCMFHRSFEDILIATTQRQFQYEWDTTVMNPIQTSIVEENQTCAPHSTINSCPPNTWLAFVYTEYPTCHHTTRCASDFGDKPVLCGPMQCVSLYYEI